VALVDPNDIFFTPFEPKLKNRFIMNIDGIPAFLVKTMARPAVYEYRRNSSVFS